MSKYLVLIPPPNVAAPCLRLSVQHTEPHRCFSPLESTAKLRQLHGQDVMWSLITTTGLVTMWSTLSFVRPKVTSLAFKFYTVYRFQLTNLKYILKRTKAYVKRWFQSKSYIFNFEIYADTISEVKNSIFYDFNQDNYDNHQNPDEPWTIEISWEICNQVGGIYTVIKTKAYKVVEMIGDKYLTLGPYCGGDVTRELNINGFLPGSPYFIAVELMRQKGYRVITGRWNIPGSPLTILFDINASRTKVLERYRWELERDIGIKIPYHDTESNDAVVFGYLVAEFITQFHQIIRQKVSTTCKEEPIIAHFHEWLGTVGLFFLMKWEVHVATVFTTHATLLGRYICASGKDLYKNLRLINPDKEANLRGILHRHLIEKAAAQYAHVFTTVSEITGLEAEYLLGWKPDIFTLNGLNLPSSSLQFKQLHLLNKRKIDDFVRKHFHDNIYFERDNVLYFFSAGRYEYRNKGIDIFIESLCRLNYLLKISRTNIRIVVFLIYPAKTNELNEPTLKRQLIHQLGKEMDLNKKIQCHVPAINEIVWRKMDAIFSGKTSFYTRQSLPPPITTHNVVNDGNDPILCELRRFHLFNYRYDHVKVVFYPQFLNKNSSLLPLDYQEFVQGCDLGVFPSYYEPWGYTPAECVNNGTPAVTTNLSGYGQFILGKNIEDPKKHGIYVVDRRHCSSKESIQELTDILLEFSLMTQSQRDVQRRLAPTLSHLLDWEQTYENYRLAHCMAVLRAT